MISWEGVAALVVALGGALGALFAGIRNIKGDQFRREVDQSAALLAGYRDMAAALRAELEQMRQTLHEERRAWALERRELHEEIDSERAERIKGAHACASEINELREQVSKLERKLGL